MLLHAVMFKAETPTPDYSEEGDAAHSRWDRELQHDPALPSGNLYRLPLIALAPLRRTDLEQTQVAVRAPYLDNNVVKTVYQAPQSVTSGTRKPRLG